MSSVFFQLEQVEVGPLQVNNGPDMPKIVLDNAVGAEINQSEPQADGVQEVHKRFEIEGLAVVTAADSVAVRVEGGSNLGVNPDTNDTVVPAVDCHFPGTSPASQEGVHPIAPEKHKSSAATIDDNVLNPQEHPLLRVSHVWQGAMSGGTVFAVRRHGVALTPENIHGSVDIGLLPAGEPLAQASGLLEQVFVPLLSKLRVNGHEQATPQTSSGQHSVADAELSAALEKYVSQLHTSEAHLTGSVQLAFPMLDAAMLAHKDDDTLSLLESCMHSWTLVLQEVKQAEREKTARGDGPLDEIHFWREKNNILGGLHEQIHMTQAQRISEYAVTNSPSCV